MNIIGRENLIRLQNKINTYTKLYDCLKLRLYLIDSNKANKTEYEKNEDEITKILTYPKIQSVSNQIWKMKIEYTDILNNL